MEITGLGNTAYVSPYGSESLQQTVPQYNAANAEGQNDVFIKKHQKKDNTASVAANVLLTGAALYGLYKGKGHIKTAFNTGKEYAGKAFDSIKEQGIKTSITNAGHQAAEAAKNGFETVKTKLPEVSFPEKLTTYANNALEFIKSIPSKFHK